MKWITRERPKIDRIACPWLIWRFVDRDAEFLYGLSANIRDDHEMLKVGMQIYEALYTWCRSPAGERHGWYPDQIPVGPRSGA